MRKSSRRWLQEHDNDVYVKLAQQQGYRSRAVYKLAQLHTRYKLFYPNMVVVDLGAAPGGWSQWVHRHLDGRVKLFALDILPMQPLAGVEFIQGDFTEEAVLMELQQAINKQAVNLVMSDMSPNISGIKAVDQPRCMLLAELARDLAFEVLAHEGDFLTKVFQGEGFDAFVKQLRQHFHQVIVRKPEASRARSPEVYVLARNFK